MGNVFRRFGVVSVALLVCGACGGASEDQATGDQPPPFQERGNELPTPAAPAATETPAPGDTMPPVASATPPSTETPVVGSNTPVAPPVQMTGTTPQPTPPAEMPPATTPPVQTPPAAGRTQVFLLFGQSNMWGVPNPQAQDLEINPKVEVLTITACSKHGTNQWVPAQPPLHGCVGQPGTGGQGPGVGPGDYFAKTIAAAFPQDTILLVPAAVPGVSIDTFQPGQQNYTNLLNRAKMAQQRGEIRGMIFHQGETDSGQNTWPNRVKTVVDRLRSDLGIGTVPFVAGELMYSPTGCCGGHNTYVNQLATLITNAAVAKADGFTAVPKSQDTFGNLHFDLPSQREFGRRFGQAMLSKLQP
jgi:hypothetical protein